jgi:2-O-methyltransferase
VSVLSVGVATFSVCSVMAYAVVDDARFAIAGGAPRRWRRLGRLGLPQHVPAHPDLISKSTIRELVGRDDPLVLEIGCNDGTDTVDLLATLPRCRIHCFECDPRPISYFRRRIVDPRVQLHEIAVSDHDGTAILHMSGGTTADADKGDWDLSSSLLAPKLHLERHPWVTFERDLEVPTVRLDAWAEMSIPGRTVDFIWMDVQGAEHLVIAGGAKTFSHSRFCYFEYYNEEMYSDQQTLRAVMRLLPKWQLLATFDDHNALAVNTAVT